MYQSEGQVPCGETQKSIGCSRDSKGIFMRLELTTFNLNKFFSFSAGYIRVFSHFAAI